ncbi:hypothetical protein FB645_002181 [Coemansia sp. IMI 203386]|nr:hypothetical protein FB645_002181 [Coemansia sp. IMI 203386]
MRRPNTYTLQLVLLVLFSTLAAKLADAAWARRHGSASPSFPSSVSDRSNKEGAKRSAVTTTFIDLLSSDERFSEFLHTVQRLRMVIPLNRIRNATLLVPTNEALRRYRKKHAGDSTHITGLVYQGVTDDQAWYHLISDRAVIPEDLVRGEMVWESFSKPWDDGAPASILDSSTDEDKDDGDGDGDGDGKDRSDSIMLKTWISSDYRVLANGVPVLAQTYSCNAGTVYMIDGLMDLPPTIQGVLQQQQTAMAAGVPGPSDKETSAPAEGSDFSFIERLVSAAGWSHILDMAGNSKEARRMHTLWAFDNRAFGAAFNYVERAYLLYGAEFAKDDDELHRAALEDTRGLASAYVSPGLISIARLGVGEHKVPGFQGSAGATVIVEQDPSSNGLSARVNGQLISTKDIVAVNGMVHSLGQVARPDGLEFTPLKALIGLNATMFVRLLKDTGLSHYIDGTKPDRELTLLVPTNRAMEDAFGYDLGDDEDEAVTNSGYADKSSLLLGSPREQQREWALYHIADGMNGIDELAENPLLRTKLATKLTDGKSQVVKAQVDMAFGVSSKHVSFNGADNILSEPLVVGNAVIYLLSSPMPTPPNMINALVQDLDLSLFVAAMGASHIVDELQQEQGVTVLAPVTNSFTSMGLLWAYLSLPGDLDARTDLGRLVKSHVLTSVVYSDEVPMHTDGSASALTVETLNGNKVGLYRTPHGMFVVSEDAESLTYLSSLPGGRPTQDSVSNSLSRISDSSALKVVKNDILLRTGVAHVLGSGLILPSNVEITSAKLLRGMKAHIFTDLLERFNLTYVLEDPRSVSKGKPVKSVRSGLTARSSDNIPDDMPQSDVVGYSLLVPSDKSWRENAAYRELVRRDHDEMSIADDEENPWRNTTTADIVHYLDMLVRIHIIPITDPSAHKPASVFSSSSRRDPSDGHHLPQAKLALADRKTYPTLLESVKLRAHEFATDRFSLQLDDVPFYQSPGGAPFVSLATVIRSGYARTGAVFEIDAALKLPPEDMGGPGGWKRFAWNAAVWLTGIGMGSGLLGVSGFWVRQWWTRTDYQSL